MSNNKLWYAEDSYHGYSLNNGISEVQIFNSNELSLIKIKAPLNSGLSSLIYYGNVDKILLANNNTSYSLITVGERNANNWAASLYSSPKILFYWNTITDNPTSTISGVEFTWPSGYRDWETDRKSTRLNSSHSAKSRMPSSA